MAWRKGHKPLDGLFRADRAQQQRPKRDWTAPDRGFRVPPERRWRAQLAADRVLRVLIGLLTVVPAGAGCFIAGAALGGTLVGVLVVAGWFAVTVWLCSLVQG